MKGACQWLSSHMACGLAGRHILQPVLMLPLLVTVSVSESLCLCTPFIVIIGHCSFIRQNDPHACGIPTCATTCERKICHVTFIVTIPIWILWQQVSGIAVIRYYMALGLGYFNHLDGS